MNKLARLIGLVLMLLLAAGVCFYVLRETWRREPDATSSPGSDPPAALAGPETATPTVAAAPPSTGVSMPAASPGLAQRLRESNDYLEFARSIHDAAKADDADAQYYLYWTLDYCHQHFRLYFGRPERPRTLDEGLRWAANNSDSLDVDEGRRVHERCRALVDPGIKEFGERAEWMQRAALAGQPNAKVALAFQLSLEAARLPDGSREAQDAIEHARRLVVEALASRDPEVIFEAGLLQGLRSGNTVDEDWAAWQIAACQRGLDCSPSAERTQTACRFVPNCQPYESLPDMLRRYAEDVAALDARAEELNRFIDAGDWQALGLGSPKTDP